MYLNCPRCGWQGLERYRTYTYCSLCNHSCEYERTEKELQTLEAAVALIGAKPKKLNGSDQNVWLPKSQCAQVQITIG